MAQVRVLVWTMVLVLGGWLPSLAQQAAGTADKTAVPTLVKFSGQLKHGNGDPLSGIVGVTFALYGSQQGGAPLWMEIQNVQPDQSGHYAVMLGSGSSAGLPADLFASGEARWVGVQAQGQPEQPRVMLLSVPYAMKAADAATIGGLPPSAFVLAVPSNSTPSPAALPTGSEAPGSISPPASLNVTTTGGTANTIPLFTTPTNIQNSILTQTGTTAVNVGGKLNLPATGTATATAGKNSRPETMVASAFNSGTSTAVPQTFQLQAEPVGNDTQTASGSLNLLFGQGTNAPAETGFKISSKGVLTFATGQTFPGAGTVASVGSGAGLTGGPITRTGTLSIATAGVTNTMLAHPALTVAAGTDLTGGGSVALGGTTTLNLDTTKVAQLNTANTFTGNQTVNGNLSATGVVTGNAFNIGSDLFAFGFIQVWNAFLGFAGNTTMVGTANTASGYKALFSNINGYDNTANGYFALLSDTAGSANTATGWESLLRNTGGNANTAIGTVALPFNTTGSDNTAIGASAGETADGSDLTGSNNTACGANTAFGNGSLTNATAIGANAEVDTDNALELGSINGVNGAAADTNVGIGTTAPGARLHIGPANTTSLRIEGPNAAGTGVAAASLGGFGDFNIDAPGIVGGRFRVKENGQVTIGGTGPVRILTVAGGLGHPIADGWDSYSSRRWKTNIQLLHGALGKVERLRGVSYDLKDSGKHEIGVIAEEVGAVVPEVVTWEKDGKDAQGVDYGRLTALLIEAVKQQQDQIRKLQAEIEETRASLRKVKVQLAAAQPELVAAK